MAKFKYIRKEMKNGKMRYYYEEPGAKANLPSTKNTPELQKKTLTTQRGTLKEGPEDLPYQSFDTSGSSFGLGSPYKEGSLYKTTEKDLTDKYNEIVSVLSDSEAKELRKLRDRTTEWAFKYDITKPLKAGDAQKGTGARFDYTMECYSEYMKRYNELKKKYKTKLWLKNTFSK